MKRLFYSVLAFLSLAAFVAGCGREEQPEQIQAPTRVKLAHIMLEKESVPEPLDIESARKIVIDRKKRERLLEIEREELKKAMAQEDFQCAVPVTLLKKRKGSK
ncbi:MAG: hypothetical protein J6U17_02225 [Kiritimatiellae bacterium]|nr:hypothetical protein [Kiritimatiellia bacterium]